MRDKVFLVFDSYAVLKMTKRVPAVSRGEFYIAVTVDVDPKYFDRAIPAAVLTIDARHIVAPTAELSVEEAPDPEAAE